MSTYYILEQGNKQGPFSFHELKERGISPTTYIWMSGLTDWKEAKEIAELSDLIQETPPSLPPMPRSYLIESILVTIFCCLPFGIAGIVNALRINEAYRIGNYVEANKYSRNAANWCGISITISISTFLLSVTILLIIIFSNYGHANNSFVLPK